MKKILKSTLILCLITLIAGLALAVVYEVTKAPIALSQEKARQKAYAAVFSSATTFEETEVQEATTSPNVLVERVVLAKDGDRLLGYVLMMTSKNGYGGDIKLAMGVTPDGTLTGISIVSQSETAGLGAKCKDKSFVSQFAGITAGVVEVTKQDPTAPNQIQAISGATITTTAVAEAVNTGLAYVRDVYFDRSGEA